MRRLNLVAGAAFLLSACSVTQESPKVGADKDEHGCIGSAGYAWCETTNQCDARGNWRKSKALRTLLRASRFSARHKSPLQTLKYDALANV